MGVGVCWAGEVEIKIEREKICLNYKTEKVHRNFHWSYHTAWTEEADNDLGKGVGSSCLLQLTRRFSDFLQMFIKNSDRQRAQCSSLKNTQVTSTLGWHHLRLCNSYYIFNLINVRSFDFWFSAQTTSMRMLCKMKLNSLQKSRYMTLSHHHCQQNL